MNRNVSMALLRKEHVKNLECCNVVVREKIKFHMLNLGTGKIISDGYCMN